MKSVSKYIITMNPLRITTKQSTTPPHTWYVECTVSKVVPEESFQNKDIVLSVFPLSRRFPHTLIGGIYIEIGSRLFVLQYCRWMMWLSASPSGHLSSDQVKAVIVNSCPVASMPLCCRDIRPNGIYVWKNKILLSFRVWHCVVFIHILRDPVPSVQP